jgi:hypothetical protein
MVEPAGHARTALASPIEGVPVGEFIARNAGPVWLTQNEFWELMPFEEDF